MQKQTKEAALALYYKCPNQELTDSLVHFDSVFQVEMSSMTRRNYCLGKLAWISYTTFACFDALFLNLFYKGSENFKPFPTGFSKQCFDICIMTF
jgi:hypothetical protein